VQKKALKYIHDWAEQFESSGEPNLGLMGELYDQLRAKSGCRRCRRTNPPDIQFQEAEPAPEVANDETRRRAEEEELARVLELSKQDKGGWGSAGGAGGGSSSGGGGSSSQAPPPVPKTNNYAQEAPYQQHRPQPPAQQPQYAPPQQQQQQQPQYAPPQPQEPAPVDISTATRVRALYTFASTEFGELSFERGDIIKVLDRGFKEWWRGAVHGKIGIFPVVYVEALPEPTAQELQEEAQEESRVFASLGLVEQLLAALKEVDPSRGDRIEERGDIQEMYQSSVALQPEINALLKKYSDQKAELEHMNANFIRAMRQYDDLRTGVAPGAPAAPVAAGPRE
jgi:signal transducing adaptor molecule